MAGRRRRILAGAGIVAGLVAVGYRHYWRTWCLTFGATAAEVASNLPGDELLPHADSVTTRAVTIDAPPSCVWPWLVQMGGGRAGDYSYDWIENLLGLDVHSAKVILPQFQNVRVGDEFPVRHGRPGRRTVRVAVLDPERALAVQLGDGNIVRIFALFPRADGTRLVSRNRIAAPWLPAIAVPPYLLLVETSSLVLERKMQLGIKERAEQLARDRAQDVWYGAPV